MVPRGTKRLRPAVAEGALKLNVDHRCWYSIRTEFLMPEIAQLGICWLRTRRARYARNRFGMTQELEGEQAKGLVDIGEKYGCADDRIGDWSSEWHWECERASALGRRTRGGSG
jgi:hypothetical protein